MINKKLIMLAIFLVSLLAVSSASATDNVTGDIVGVDETVPGIVKNTTDDSVSADESGIATFDELAKEINASEKGKVLDLAKDYMYVNGPTNGIRIDKAITIDGHGATLDGDHLSRIFNVTADNVMLKNIQFINARSDGDGGAVHWNGKGGVLSNCTFVDCSASNGGAVYAYLSSISLIDCSFLGNSAIIKPLTLLQQSSAWFQSIRLRDVISSTIPSEASLRLERQLHFISMKTI